MRSAPTVWITSKPSSFGICTSRNTRSGDLIEDRVDGLEAVAGFADDVDVGFDAEQ